MNMHILGDITLERVQEYCKKHFSQTCTETCPFNFCELAPKNWGITIDKALVFDKGKLYVRTLTVTKQDISDLLGSGYIQLDREDD